MEKFIYLLSDPETGFVRWVGAAKNPGQRYKTHLYDVKLTAKREWICDLKAKGLLPVMDVLTATAIESWEEEEIFLIMYFRFLGANLLNVQNGGYGVGKVHSEETREKIRRAWKRGEMSPETRARMSASQKARMSVRTVSPETREKIRAAFLGKPRSAETIEKMRKAAIGKVCSAEAREKISRVLTGMKRSEETRAKMREAQRLRALSKKLASDTQTTHANT